MSVAIFAVNGSVVVFQSVATVLTSRCVETHSLCLRVSFFFSRQGRNLHAKARHVAPARLYKKLISCTFVPKTTLRAIATFILSPSKSHSHTVLARQLEVHHSESILSGPKKSFFRGVNHTRINYAKSYPRANKIIMVRAGRGHHHNQQRSSPRKQKKPGASQPPLHQESEDETSVILSPTPFALPSIPSEPQQDDLMSRLDQRQQMFSQFGELLGELQARDKGVEAWRTLAAKELAAARKRCQDEAEARSRAEKMAAKASAEASAKAEEALAARRETFRRCEETKAALCGAAARASQAAVVKSRLESVEARSACDMAIWAAEKCRMRRALEELNSALGAARGAAEAARVDHQRTLLVVRAEMEAQREAFGREAEVTKASVEAAEEARDRALEEIQLTREATKLAEAAAREKERSRVEDISEWSREADSERDARCAADAATDAALSMVSRAERHEKEVMADCEARLGSARDVTNGIFRERDAAQTALSELEMRSRGVAKREHSMMLRVDAMEASEAALRAAFAQARGDLAGAAEAKLVAEEERDAARQDAVAAKDALDEATLRAQTETSELRNKVKEQQMCFDANDRNARAALADAIASRDALLAAFEARNAMVESDIQKRVGASQNAHNRVKKLADALQVELDARLNELSETLQTLEKERNEANTIRARSMEEKDAWERTVSEREAAHTSERRRLVAELDREQIRSKELESDKWEAIRHMESVAERETNLQSRMEEAETIAKTNLDTLEETRRSLEESVRECRNAQSRRLAAEEALATQNEVANESIAEARLEIETLRNDVKRATRAGAERVTHFQKTAVDASDRCNAAEAAMGATRADCDAAKEQAREKEIQMKRTREVAQRMSVAANDAVSRASVAADTNGVVLSAADAYAICAKSRHLCDAVVFEARSALTALDAELAVEEARSSASRVRADASNAIAEARLDREAAVEQSQRARDAHAATNDALRRASAALEREREYANRLEKEGFDEVIDVRNELVDLRQRVATAETEAETAAKDANETRQKLRDAQHESKAAVATLTARLRAAERIVEAERDRRKEDENLLKTQAAQVERDAAGAAQAARDANAALRAEIEQQRVSTYTLRHENAELERKLEESTLAKDAADREIDTLRKSAAEADQRASRAAQIEKALRRDVDKLRRSQHDSRRRHSFQSSTNVTTSLDSDDASFERMRRRWRSQSDLKERSNNDTETQRASAESAAASSSSHRGEDPLGQNVTSLALSEGKGHPAFTAIQDDEIKRHLALAAQARAGGLLPTPRDDDDVAEASIERYEQHAQARDSSASSINIASLHARQLEESAFDDNHGNVPFSSQSQCDASTTQTKQAIAAAAMYLDKRRQRDVKRQLAEELRKPQPDSVLHTESTKTTEEHAADNPHQDLSALELADHKTAVSSSGSSRTNSSQESSRRGLRDGIRHPYAVAPARIGAGGAQHRKMLPKIASGASRKQQRKHTK